MVFSKLPEKGKVKTRMIPKLGEQQAFNLYCQLLQSTLSQLDGLQLDKTLWVKGEPIDKISRIVPVKDHWQLFPQHGNNLGESLSHALEQMIMCYQKLVLIGGDCVAIQKDYIEQALMHLDSYDCVVGPALDGGFVMIGFNSLFMQEQERGVFKTVFSDIEWGSESVYQQLINNLQVLNIGTISLELLWDIDRPEDLVYLKGYAAFEKFLS